MYVSRCLQPAVSWNTWAALGELGWGEGEWLRLVHTHTHNTHVMVPTLPPEVGDVLGEEEEEEDDESLSTSSGCCSTSPLSLSRFPCIPPVR